MLKTENLLLGTKFKYLLVNRLGVDNAVLWVVFNKIWSLFKTPVLVIFIALFLTPEQQGIWYTFLNLASLTIFAELNFTTIVTQFISHDYAKLSTRNGFVLGSKYYTDRLFGLVRYAIKLYLVIIPVAIIILTAVGVYFFRDQSRGIVIAWIIYSIIGGVSLSTSLLQSVYQGLDKVIDIQKNIITGSIFTILFNCILLWTGFNIWALVLGNFISLVLMGYLLYKRGRSFWVQLYRHKISYKFNWFKEIVPIQFKYAVSCVSGYFVFFLYTPVVYKYGGAVLAGQFGLTFTAYNALVSLANSWVDSKLPKFNILVSNNHRMELRHLFKKTSVLGCIFFVIGSVGFLLLMAVLNYFSFYNTRFLSIDIAAIFLLAQVPMLIINLMAKYLRAHKDEPYFILSALNGLMIAGAIFIIYPIFGLLWLSISVNIVYWFIMLPLSIILFRKYDRIYEERAKIQG